MGVIKNLMVRAGADFSDITKQAKKASASMRGMKTSVTASCGQMTKAVNGMKKVMGAIGVVASVTAIVSFSKSAKEAYETQIESETKLAQVMRNTMGATTEEVSKIKELCAAQQALGVVGDEVQLAGAQELATYLSLTSSLETLIPVMNDMVAQQYGLSASAENATNIATMLGKVMSGQTGGLSRYGYYFTKAQEEVLKYGTEAQKAATLASVVEESVGGMNAALAATPSGRLKQVSNTLGDIKEQFGGAVTSVLTTFLPVLNTVASVLASIATLANKVAQAIANVFGRGASSASTAVSYTAAASGAMDDLTDSTNAAGSAAAKLGTYGFDTLQKLTSSSSGSGSSTEAVDIGGGGGVSESVNGADEAGETLGWLEKGLQRIKATVASINLDNLTGAMDRLKKAVEPITKGLFSGLAWAYDNILDPLAHWTMESALPAALDVLAGAAKVLTAAAKALQPLATWLWEEFLKPIASWTGGAIISALEGLAIALEKISGWIEKNQGLVQAMTVTVGAFFVAWEATAIAEFLINAGGLAGVIAKVTTALKACTVAKLADKLETAALCALYIKDWAVALAANVVALGKDAAAWVALRAEWIAGKIALIASTAAEVAHTAASWAATAATTAFGVAMSILTSPITLVIAAIAALVAGIVLLVKNWDTVKAAGVATWEKIKGAWGMASEWFQTNVLLPVTEGFRGMVNGVIGFFEGLANGAIRAVNKLIEGLNSISFTTPDWLPEIGGKTVGFNLSPVSSISLPRLANGAVFEGNDPFLAVVNDQKHGVNVETPLATMIEAMMTALRATDRDENIIANINVAFDGQLAALARILRPYIEADVQRTGGRASTVKGVV